jgi:hypothetical protein
MQLLDTDKDGAVTHPEYTAAFAKVFSDWNTDKSGVLTDEQLREGIDKDLSPFGRGGPPPFMAPGNGGGPPPGF